MTFELIVIIIEFIFLLFCAAFFSGTETAITAITGVQYKALKKSRSKKNKRTVFLIKKKDEIVSATLIGTNFVNTLSSALITAFVIANYGQVYLGYATAITTIMIIIFAEIVPKAFATYRPVELTRNSSIILYFLRLILKPIIFIFSIVSNFIIKLFSKNRVISSSSTEDYLKTLINISLADGTFQTGEHDLIKRAVQLHELKLDSIMTTKEKIISVIENSSLADAVKVFRKTKFSRLLVFDGNNENIVGLIHYKDLLFYTKDESSKYDNLDISEYEAAIKKIQIKNLIRPIIFIPTTANIFSALKIMSNNKKNMAVVIDEYGLVNGLITIDDISAAIFGSIQDEYAKATDNPLQELQAIGKNQIRIPGDIPLVKLNEFLGCNFSSIYNNTLGGLVLEKAEYLPAIGEIVRVNNIDFIVEKLDGAKIKFLVADISKLLYH